MEKGVEFADGVVEVGVGPCVTLVVEKPGRETVRLERGVELGSMAVVEVAGVGGPSGGEGNGVEVMHVNLPETACVCHLAAADDSTESQADQLLSQLNLQNNF